MKLCGEVGGDNAPIVSRLAAHFFLDRALLGLPIESNFGL